MKEIWKPFRHGYYEVSNLGRVRRVSSGRVLKVSPDKDGYQQTHTCCHGKERTHKIHQLVATAFLGPCPDGMEVHHKDFDKENNRWDNLEYITHAKHQQIHGKLSWHDVHEIRRLYCEGCTQRSLAQKFGVFRTTIQHIVENKIWKKAA